MHAAHGTGTRRNRSIDIDNGGSNRYRDEVDIGRCYTTPRYFITHTGSHDYVAEMSQVFKETEWSNTREEHRRRVFEGGRGNLRTR